MSPRVSSPAGVPLYARALSRPAALSHAETAPQLFAVTCVPAMKRSVSSPCRSAAPGTRARRVHQRGRAHSALSAVVLGFDAGSATAARRSATRPSPPPWDYSFAGANDGRFRGRWATFGRDHGRGDGAAGFSTPSTRPRRAGRQAGPRPRSPPRPARRRSACSPRPRPPAVIARHRPPSSCPAVPQNQHRTFPRRRTKNRSKMAARARAGDRGARGEPDTPGGGTPRSPPPHRFLALMPVNTGRIAGLSTGDVTPEIRQEADKPGRRAGHRRDPVPRVSDGRGRRDARCDRRRRAARAAASCAPASTPSHTAACSKAPSWS